MIISDHTLFESGRHEPGCFIKDMKANDPCIQDNCAFKNVRSVLIGKSSILHLSQRAERFTGMTGLVWCTSKIRSSPKINSGNVK